MKTNLLLVLLFFSVAIYGQEVCTNGIDDDNDGLVDLNDPDCQCGSNIEVPSLIPNASFEDYTICPTNHSQLNRATGWIQATNATSDYFNCGYAFPAVAPAGLNNYPDGNGVVGAFYVTHYKEYVGTQLNSPMLAGVTYRLAFKIAGMSVISGDYLASTPVSNFGPVDVTIFGTANASHLPVSTTESPDVADPAWVEIGHTNYAPQSVWSDIVIEFTPTFTVNAIMIGAPTVLPSTYPSIANGRPFPYMMYDSLILNQLDLFEPVAINTTGTFCNNDVQLSFSGSFPGYTFQWFLNGVAIANATGATLAVTTFHPGDVYSVRGANTDGCFLSESFEIQTIVPNKPVVANLSYCQNAIAAPLSATGSNLLWYTNATGGTGSTAAPTPTTTTPGTFTYYVTQSCGIESERAALTVTVNPLLTPNFDPIDPICYGATAPALPSMSPNGIAGTWTPNVIDNTQNNDYVFVPGVSQCGVNQTLSVAITNPVEFAISGGCENGAYIMRAAPLSGSFDPDVFDFQWRDAAGNDLGENQPFLDLTAIVNATPETESFPLAYTLTVTDIHGCDSTKDFTVEKIFCKIPKGVSPNGDGDNDFFDLRGLQVKRLEIFNRYGVEVYAMDNYTTQWAGQTTSGRELPDATYYYHIETDDASPKTGWVYLIH